MRKVVSFEEVLKVNGSAAQKTLVSAMVEWWMASDEKDALLQIAAAPGSDLAGIKSSVMAGLTKAAELLGVNPESFISEEELESLKDITPAQVVEVLDAIHKQWVADNFTAKRWAEKYFKGQLGQYRKTSRIGWDEVRKDLLFVQQYLTAAGSTLTIEEIEAVYTAYAAADTTEEDIPVIVDKAMTFAEEIIPQMEAFAKKDQKRAPKVRAFLEEHQDAKEVMKLLVEAL